MLVDVGRVQLLYNWRACCGSYSDPCALHHFEELECGAASLVGIDNKVQVMRLVPPGQLGVVRMGVLGAGELGERERKHVGQCKAGD
jgi:hypothetical protein